MARVKREKPKERKSTHSDREVSVHLAPTVELLHEHVSEALCREVYQDLRVSERERRWSLYSLAHFWLAVVLAAPRSLSQLLERSRAGDPTGLLPHIAASSEAFFQKSKAMGSGFFMALYGRFVASVEAKAPRRYCQELAHLGEKFTDVLVIDGSRLDKIAHRLKILSTEKAVILPGCLLGVYDLFRGIATQLWFEADAAAAEFNRALQAIECLPANSLILGDRLYCSVALFGALNANSAFGVFRLNKAVSIKKVRRLSRQVSNGSLLEDWIVQAGRKGTEIELRLVILKHGGKTHQALTNVLDSERLPPQDVAALYPQRWKIERLFYDLKVVLNLKRLYAANPNAVAMQVFATAMVHVAFRITQADIAEEHGIAPEELSPEKLFPLLALTAIKLLEAEFYFEATQAANPHVTLKRPSWKDIPGTVVSLRHLRRQLRKGKRAERGYHKDRAKWKSFTKIAGAEGLT